MCFHRKAYAAKNKHKISNDMQDSSVQHKNLPDNQKEIFATRQSKQTNHASKVSQIYCIILHKQAPSTSSQSWQQNSTCTAKRVAH
jgi:hypothetical protein